jgi:hypothetical protein
MRRISMVLIALTLLGTGASNVGAAAPAISSGQHTLATAAAANKYTFLVFSKDNGPAEQAMSDTVNNELQTRADRAVSATVNVADAVEKPLVDRFGLERAPMPMTIAVAPNGAITGIFAKTVTKEQIAGAFVTPAMTHCMKSLQDGKMVFICLSTTGVITTPAGVVDFRQDPQFVNRSIVVHIPQGSRDEAKFLQELKLGAQATDGATIAFLAPPGVLVGKFTTATTKDELGKALHSAGKCCDDPNCKHNHK